MANPIPQTRYVVKNYLRIEAEKEPDKRLPLRPHGQLVAVRVEEMETLPAGKIEDRLCDPAARGFDPGLGIDQIDGVEDHERAARPRRRHGGETAAQPAVGEFAIGRPVIGEGPAERL